MQGSFAYSSLPLTYWALIGMCALLIGMSKTGVPGVSMIVVPLMAMIFGGESVNWRIAANFNHSRFICGLVLSPSCRMETIAKSAPMGIIGAICRPVDWHIGK